MHGDLLDAPLPDIEEKRQKFLEEIKARAKASWQTKRIPDAEKLYGKAIDVACHKIDGKRHEEGRHLLYSNRAAVRLLTGNHAGALRDCDRCMDIDAAFIKAHFSRRVLERARNFFCGIYLKMYPQSK